MWKKALRSCKLIAEEFVSFRWMTVESTSINRLTDFKSLPDVHCLPSMFLDNDGNVLRGSGGNSPP